ncbi:hypothetical protein FG386_003627 [Cryptosporidium ryanae]|uniref:uncharacterized protein n=1 Tax=Cryptosporidium ryanae TaxID=515981 RepID=UPI003519FF2A|nr:hypothetical protein FG386_003627 [Cryptosporidium ryanae]
MSIYIMKFKDNDDKKTSDENIPEIPIIRDSLSRGNNVKEKMIHRPINTQMDFLPEKQIDKIKMPQTPTGFTRTSSIRDLRLVSFFLNFSFN